MHFIGLSMGAVANHCPGIAGARLQSLDAAHLSAVEQPEAFAHLQTDFWDALQAASPREICAHLRRKGLRGGAA